MDKLLIINAHPKVKSSTSFSLQVLTRFKEAYASSNPNGAVEQIDLYEDHVPMIDRTVLSAWEKAAKGETLSEEEQLVTNRMTEILRQFKSAHKYVIAMPLHNFNIPSKLKDYMDNVLIARETFKYTENGSVGLLKDGRSLVVIQGSGGVYTNNDWYTEVEYSHKYLKSMFNFLGVEDYRIIRAQGTSIMKPEEVLEQAYQEAEEAARHLSLVSANG
ncbi:FMN-dependent NADH-azoreductase [Paenibacillus sp. NPDC056579]|uniref:FMN-dependent NADH-azoreductase n=1 Tax=unclassified Paenibacillus TaxID=185978 RepID=UPI001EF8A5D8|nr:NAD(P)H-dependent oxidoreductase [Paenibacillus sp. H1-7]ULL15006.1 FMN-dependent NADH-azoreductase [Paenibacillus sp. H1-7]